MTPPTPQDISGLQCQTASSSPGPSPGLHRADVMVLGAVLGLIACLASLVWFRTGLPGEAVGIISTVAGIFGACLRDALQFEFGSSRGSRDKDTVIKKMSKGSGL